MNTNFVPMELQTEAQTHLMFQFTEFISARPAVFDPENILYRDS